MEDWAISAQQAEEIYDKRRIFERMKVPLIILEYEHKIADKDSREFQELDSKYKNMKKNYEDSEREIEQMESDHQAWLRNSSL